MKIEKFGFPALSVYAIDIINLDKYQLAEQRY